MTANKMTGNKMTGNKMTGNKQSAFWGLIQCGRCGSAAC